VESVKNGDLWGGLALIAFAALYAWAGSDLKLVSSLGIGPGLFPRLLAGILGLLGVLIAVQAVVFRNAEAVEDSEPPDPVPLRSLLLVSAGPAAFAVMAVPLGVVPALAGAVFVSAFASREISVVEAFVTTVVLVAACVLLFRYGLGLPLVLFGDLLTGAE